MKKNRRSVPPSAPPVRRGRRDYAITALLVVLVLVVGAALWFTGDGFHSRLVRADGNASVAPEITREPEALTVAWGEESPATAPPERHGPLTAGTVVLTGSAHDVEGRDPVTGKQLWHYSRRKELCGIDTAWGYAITVWRFGGGCGDVTAIRGASGTYARSRAGEAAEPRRIITTVEHVLSYSDYQLELWRSDLVRTLRLGPTETPAEPEQATVPVCRIHHAADNMGMVSVLQRCPGDRGLRLTFYTSVPKEDVTPEERAVWQSSARDGMILGMSAEQALLYVNDPDPRFVVVSYKKSPKDAAPPVKTAQVTKEYPAEQAPHLGRPVLQTDKSIFWNDGQHLYCFDATTFELLWSTDGVVGTPGVLSSLKNSPNWLVAPVRGGVALVNGVTGAISKKLPLPGPPVSKVTVFRGMIVVQQGTKVKGIRATYGNF